MTLALTLTATPSSALSGPAALPAAPPPASTAPSAPGGQSPVTLTLITGDVVVYTPTGKGAPATTIKPAPRPGGAPVTFLTLPSRDGGHLVLPSDAAPLVAAGTLDEELFDVDTLARDGRTAAIPLIIDYGAKAAAAAKTADALPGTGNVRSLTAINGAAVRVAAKDTKAFWTGLAGDGAKKLTAGGATGIEKVWLDRRVRMSLDKSVPLIGAPTAWQRGLDGAGVKVAVLDSGIDAAHPDLAGRIAATQNFSDSATTTDKVGHGTHVASTIAGTGAASGGKYKGVAPAASLLVGKVLGDDGNGDWSWAIAGMQWAAEQGADVVNMSLGGCCGDGTDPMSEALNQLTATYGTLFVTAAGNDSQRLTINVPAAADQALAVGAVDKDTGTTLAAFSSKGPRLGDAAVKPNIVAPGVDIVAARSADSTVPAVPGADQYTQNSGTSMATPHVAGAAALLAQQHADWTAPQLRDALTSTARRNADHTWFEQGSGRVDVARAVTQQVFATSVVDFGRPGSAPVTRPITYRNTGDQPVTLTLAPITKGWSGNPAPTGAVQLAATSVTVPARGTAAVNLTIDPRLGAVGAYGGWITATGAGGVQLVTPFSYYTGPATHELTVSMINSYGTKEFVPNYQGEPIVYMIPLKRGNSAEDPFNPAAYYTLKLDYTGAHEPVPLPAGDYEVIGVAPEWQLSNRNSWVVQKVTLDADRTVTLDARTTTSIRPVMTPAAEGPGTAWYVRTFTDRTSPVSVYGGAGAGQDLFVTPVSSVSAGTLRLSHQWNMYPQVLTSATAGSLTLHPAYDPESLRGALTAVTSYPVVFAGQGTDADFQNLDVTGKLVLVAVPAGTGATPYVTAALQMDNAARAAGNRGAAGLIGYLDVTGGRARVPAGSPAFHRFGLTVAEGRALRSAVAAGPVSVRLQPYSGPDVAYHLRFDERGQIPSAPRQVTTSALTKLDVSYHADKPDTYGWEYGVSATTEQPGDIPYGGPLRLPLTRTEYFGPIDSRVTWARSITSESLLLHSTDRFTETTRTERWFKAPLVPGAANVPSGYPVSVPCAMCRDGDRFVPAEQWLDSDPRHFSDLSAVTATPKLTVGGQQLTAQGRAPRSFTVPAGSAQYQLDAVDTSDRTLSSRVTTGSRFNSVSPSGTPAGYTCNFGPACTVQPATLLTYDLPLDVLNRAAAGQSFEFDVRAAAHATVATPPVVTWTNVEWSVDDGTTWRSATVTKPATGRFHAQLTHPALGQTNGYVSLRVTAYDDKGGSTTQTITRAYALK
ncbi:peptidase [Sphaerisporangium rufum]|uniref:Peptidase n=1 Tax=Sphaerisporangium rufum TaxID=1381558 RepID=A0A919R5I2_9ACTN|nr:S8 family serine peptidase [Sphaerisporangium rufum]GII77497.1 peptidase [Sphaerisporangium rufum]